MTDEKHVATKPNRKTAMSDLLNIFRFRELAAGFHDTEAEGDNLCGEEEVDHI